MLKYVLGAILIAFAWTAVLLLRLPEWIAIAATAIVVLFLLTLYLIRRARARRAARELERAIAAQGEAHAKLVRPEQEAEIRALQTEFLKAVSALKASRLGRGGTDALYALPWYMIIGPPGAGKSTALRNSGLHFPYLSPQGGAVRGIGGTRNCDWWLTNEAILLDTAGRYTSEDDDRDEWLAFLDLLKTNRSKKPINGILVAVSVAELAQASEEEVGTLAQRIRERVDEVMERLQIVAPLYLLLTKCDLIEGFVEIFGDLNKNDRGQIWGFTLPVGGEPRPPGEVFHEHFDELLAGVRKRALRRIGQERRIDVREKIYQFPQQFALLRDNLAGFVETLFSRNIYKETPLLRGIYFTSGTQEGRPIDRVITAMAQAFGVAPRLAAYEPPVEQKSYFLRDVFHHVVFPDAPLAARTRAEARRQRYRTYAVGASIFGVALLVSSLPAYSFVKNRELIASTEAIVRSVAAHREAAGRGDPIPLEKLEPLRRRVGELHEYETTRPPPHLRFGMYRGGALYPQVKALYAEALRTDLLGPIIRRGAEELATFAREGRGGAAPAEHARLLRLLKMYLLVTAPRAQEEPALGEALQKWLAETLVAEWSSQLSEPPDETRLATMGASAQLFAELLSTDPSLAFSRDEKLVQAARVALADVPAETLVLEPLVEELSRDGYDLTLARILGGTTGPIQTNRIVRGAFTRQGWEERIKPRLESMGGVIEPWVLGSVGSRLGKKDEQLALLKARYFELYIQEWQEFLSSLRVKESTSSIEALSVLQDLTRGVPPPYGRLMREVAYQTTLDPPDPAAQKGKALLEAAAAKGTKKLGNKGALVEAARERLTRGEDERLLGPADVAAAFAGFTAFGVPPPPPPSQEGTPPSAQAQQVALDVYQEQLEFLRDALTNYLENPDNTDAVMARLEAARTRVKALIEAQEIGWRPRFQSLLWPPIEGASLSTTKAVAGGKGLAWCNEVVVPFDRTLRGKYPFDASGHDAALTDLADFYKPDGVLWTFYQEKLADDVQRVGDRFEFSTRLGGQAGFSEALLGFLARSHEITTVLFPPGAKEPLVEFEVRIRPSPGVASITFELDGQVVKAQNEPDRWHKLRWPGEGRKGAAIRVKGAQNLSETIRQDGDFGLFRLLEAGTVSASLSSRVFSVTWPLGSRSGVTITFDFRPLRTEAPFFGLSRRGGMKLFQSFRGGGVYPPHAIARGGGCRVK